VFVTPSEARKEMEDNRVVVAVEDVREIETEEQCDNDDIRNVVIEETYPTPYLPSRITITEKPYGKLYD